MTSALTIAFIDKRPLAAARALIAMDPADAGALLDAIPTRYAAKLITAAGAWPSSAILVEMRAPNAAALLRELDYPDATALLRLAPEETRRALLAELPAGLRRDFEVSLSFPEDSVGAHMTTSVITLSREHAIADARHLIGRSETGAVVYVVDDERRLVGIIDAADLLRGASNAALSEAMDAGPSPIPARARLASIAELEAWGEHSELPVMSRQKRLLGALTRKALRRALAVGEEAAARGGDSIAVALAATFAESAIALARLLAEAAPSAQHEERAP